MTNTTMGASTNTVFTLPNGATLTPIGSAILDILTGFIYADEENGADVVEGEYTVTQKPNEVSIMDLIQMHQEETSCSKLTTQ